MKVTTANNKVAAEFCEALGLKHVVSLDIHLALDEIMTVTAQFYPEEDGVKQMIPVFKKFRLEPIGE